MAFLVAAERTGSVQPFMFQDVILESRLELSIVLPRSRIIGELTSNPFSKISQKLIQFRHHHSM
tara:strand:+ start:710 stop:901 length:192 start_codon:yes stop_codon:yes gene_type:complete